MALPYDISNWRETINTMAMEEYQRRSIWPSEYMMEFFTPNIYSSNVPIFKQATARNFEDNTRHGQRTFTQLSTTITPDDPLKSDYTIGLQQLENNPEVLTSQIPQSLGVSIVRAKENRLMALAADSGLTDGNTTEFEDDASLENLPQAAEIALAEAQAALYGRDVDDDFRICLCDRDFYSYLRRSNTYGDLNKLEGAAQARSTGAHVRNFMADNTLFVNVGSTPIHKPDAQDLSSDTDYPSQYRRNFSNDNIRAILLQRRAITLKVNARMTLETPMIDELQSVLFLARLNMGSAITLSDGIQIITDDSNTTGDIGS